MRRRRRGTLGLGLVGIVGLVLVLSVQSFLVPVSSPISGVVPLTAPPPLELVELDLGKSNYVSPSLVYNGYMNTNDRSFPVYLAGPATHQFWSLSHSVMELAPRLPATTQGHDTGVLLFESAGAPSMTLHGIGAFSVDAAGGGGGTGGDGFEAYFLLAPTRIGNWTMAYFATDPEGPNGTFLYPQGSVMFPYAEKPYIVLQWDPVYDDRAAFNLYLVRPQPDGAVTPANILGVGPIGEPTKGFPGPDQFLSFTASYSLKSNFLTAQVTDVKDSTVDYRLWANLSSYGFGRPESGDLGTAPFYFGMGGSGNFPTGWGLTFLSLSENSTSTTGPPPPPTGEVVPGPAGLAASTSPRPRLG